MLFDQDFYTVQLSTVMLHPGYDSNQWLQFNGYTDVKCMPGQHDGYTSLCGKLCHGSDELESWKQKKDLAGL